MFRHNQALNVHPFYASRKAEQHEQARIAREQDAARYLAERKAQAERNAGRRVLIAR